MVSPLIALREEEEEESAGGLDLEVSPPKDQFTQVSDPLSIYSIYYVRCR